MADSSNPFGFGSGEFDDLAREARDMIGKFVAAQGLGGLFEDKGRREPETAAAAGTGVWAVCSSDDDGGARVEQVFATEIDALRAHQHNTDPGRKVRFLPYGIAVSALDD